VKTTSFFFPKIELYIIDPEFLWKSSKVVDETAPLTLL